MTTVWSNLREKFRTSERCTEASCHDRSASSAADGDEVEPPDRAEIGRAAWRYVHSLAAHHPEQPTAQEQEDAQAWLASFVQFYPCPHCAEHFIPICEKSPPRTASREEYSVWWCEAHNKVSYWLKNEQRPCDPARLIAAGLAGLALDELPASGKVE
uniref:Sulfhydryl oxidase n=1 Tax=Alexandrium catenella TaxID=2925 RepID=A0A7S1L598_ALECA|mmetsp:Transcript_106703/g.283836  ORF Transcript_106703/g.283836 Transcript_106703/m.283836 type:complete len:157 (+) Transcript_106703:102-572(+)|eukprot:CAMPEP_0171191432 /NCGR_PEP_ID=MMETSP0790-20130122/19360_1 /TAXON_ID=2925 /ORGANISM="Alexandrium catenella, Strain OF101" /LENGTH=156 /DNA_ID=CAMNT_0011656577 /DNA_START=75 /DNA_END=545 /DNA_ORIENTATION=+